MVPCVLSLEDSSLLVKHLFVFLLGTMRHCWSPALGLHQQESGQTHAAYLTECPLGKHLGPDEYLLTLVAPAGETASFSG